MFGGFMQKRRNKKLIAAVKRGDADDVATLLDAGADIETTDEKSWGMTPVSLAAINAHATVMGLLLDRGAKINATDNQGETALVNAVRWKKVEIAQELLRRGADKTIANNKGESVGKLALKWKSKDFYEMLGVKEPAARVAAEPAPAPAPRPRVDNPDEVVFFRPHGDRLLQETFNFSARERITLVRKGMDGPVEAVTRDSFEALGDKAALRHAFEIYKTKGGSLKESEIFPDALGKISTLPGRQP